MDTDQPTQPASEVPSTTTQSMPPTPPQNPPVTEPPYSAPLQSTPAHPGGAKRPTVIIAVAVILVILATVGGIIWMSMAAKRELQQQVQAQVKEMTALEKSYKSVRTILDEKTPSPEAETTNLLKTNPTRISDVNANVLGAEEDLNIALNRRLGDQYKQSRTSLRNITSINTKIATVYQGNPLVKPFLPDATSLISDTKDFAEESDALLSYLNQINNLEVSSKTLGYQIGLALQESILRNADPDSVANFKSKVNELDDIYEDYKAIDTSGLPEDLRVSHDETLATFSEDVSIFSELVTALERRDAAMLQQAIQSLIIQSESESAAAEIEVRSFWNEHETITKATTIREQWQQFGEDKLGIAF
ncbi:hypothetical protein IPM65_04155 [Candidatus Roizmanbacteria bacterium]|nr:MAG: hypothetical protein IPM65_04155 [Candidatus Roizmanbacteria bacterium]